MLAGDASDTVVTGGGTKLSIREAADAVGITKASLYYRYASKLDLLMAIIDPIIDHRRSVVDDIDAVPHDEESIRVVLCAYLRGLIRHRDAGALCIRDTVAIIDVIADQCPDLIDANKRPWVWLAGPDATAVRVLRASTALEVLEVALLSTELVPGADDSLVERTLLAAATCVLTACGTG